MNCGNIFIGVRGKQTRTALAKSPQNEQKALAAELTLTSHLKAIRNIELVLGRCLTCCDDYRLFSSACESDSVGTIEAVVLTTCLLWYVKCHLASSYS